LAGRRWGACELQQGFPLIRYKGINLDEFLYIGDTEGGVGDDRAALILLPRSSGIQLFWGYPDLNAGQTTITGIADFPIIISVGFWVHKHMDLTLILHR